MFFFKFNNKILNNEFYSFLQLNISSFILLLKDKVFFVKFLIILHLYKMLTLSNKSDMLINIQKIFASQK